MGFLIQPLATSSALGKVASRLPGVGHGCSQVLLWCRWLAAVVSFLLGVWPADYAVASEFDEYAVKAAYLYNFAKFVEWPPGVFTSADAPLRICIVGDNPFGDALGSLSGKRVDEHPVEIRTIPALTGFDSCHIAYVSRSDPARVRTVLNKLAHLPILTVSDIDDFAQAGGMIGLVEADQRIRFNINLVVTRQANLKLSSQLLKLAIIVE